jgi:hypothetical protein
MVGQAFAQTCPPDCPYKGGGPAATDCLVEYDGVAPIDPSSRLLTCYDGDTACDADGQLDGVCTFAIRTCVNNADPSLPQCTVGPVERVRVLGRQSGPAGDLQAAIDGILPTSSNVCTDPVNVAVPVRQAATTPLGMRRFSLNTDGANGRPVSQLWVVLGPLGELPVGTFEGYLDLYAGAPDPQTGMAQVDILGASPFIEASILGMAAVCIRPVTPTVAAGVLACGRRGAHLLRVSARASDTSDRDVLALDCRSSSAQFDTDLMLNHRLGIVGQNGFTAQDCAALNGVVEGPSDPHPNVCNQQLPPDFRFLDTVDNTPGAAVAQVTAEILFENNLPCGDEPSMSFGTLAIPITTESSKATILNANNVTGQARVAEGFGINFSCEDWTTEDSSGMVVLSTPLFVDQDLRAVGFGFQDLVGRFEFAD